MAEVDLREYKELELAIKEMERVQTASPQRASPLIARALENARKRFVELAREIQVEQAQVVRAAEYAAVIQNETALNDREKEEFGGLLLKRFFTKQDWKQLDSFYAVTWDKLTDHGKAEISHRLWEGLRYGEGKFSELPGHIKEKEAERIYNSLVKRETASVLTGQIPEIDRKDFISAFEHGDKTASFKILNRSGFVENVSLTTVLPVESVDVTANREAEQEVIAARSFDSTQKQIKETPPEGSLADLDLRSIDLSELKSVHETTTSVAPLTLGVSKATHKEL